MSADPSETAISTTSAERQAKARQLAIGVARALDETKCEDVLVLDVRRLSQVTDFLVIASGTSERQLGAAAAKAMEAGEEMEEKSFGGAKERSSTWVVLDFIDVVVHVFEPETRALYDLEMLWGEAPTIDWTDGRPPRRAGSPNRPASHE